MRQLKRFTAVNTLASILLLLIFALLSYDRFHAEELRENNANLERCIRTFGELLKHKGESFQLTDGKLLAGDYVLNGNFEVPDKVREIFGGTATIFMGDTRVSTNVLQADGRRAIGTRLEGPAYTAIFKQGKAFRGETSILGVPYFTAYDPIRDSNGEIIGALYVGLKKSEFQAHHTLVKSQMALILFGLSIVFISFMILFNKLAKKAEGAIAADHRFLQRLIDTIPNPIFYKDINGRYLGCNKAYEIFIGMTREQLTGKSVFDIATPHLAEIYHQADQELFQKRGVQVYESPATNSAGVPLEVIFYKATFSAADGSLGGLIGTILDITERKRIEDQLRALSCGVEQSPASIVITDREGNIEYANPKFSRLTGYSSTEAIGQNPRILKSGLTRPEVHRQLWETILSGNEWHGEFCNKKKNGELYWESASISPIVDASGEISRFIAVKEDITAKKNAESVLAEKERLLSGILNGIQDGICMLDEDLRIVRVNPFFERYYAQKMPFLGQKCHEVFWSRSEPCDGCPSIITLRSGERASRIFSDNQSGEIAWFELVSFPLLDSETSRVTGVVEYVRDITRRKRAEDEVRELNQELEDRIEKKSGQLLQAREELIRKEKLAILGQLSGSVGHELRNPLGVMSNAVYFLKMVHADRDETTREYLDMIKHEIDNSQRIITDLLDFARTGTPETKMVTVRQLLAESIAKCVIPENVEQQTELADNLPLLMVDPQQMEQVFQNLITNAIQAMPKGGSVLVSARQVRGNKENLKPRSSNLDPDFIKISVTDSGEGILAENMGKLFQPLFTTKAKGIGLGLVVCRNLTEANGGWIEVDSRLGEGTTFTVIFPAGEVERSQP